MPPSLAPSLVGFQVQRSGVEDEVRRSRGSAPSFEFSFTRTSRDLKVEVEEQANQKHQKRNNGVRSKVTRTSQKEEEGPEFQVDSPNLHDDDAMFARWREKQRRSHLANATVISLSCDEWAPQDEPLDLSSSARKRVLSINNNSEAEKYKALRRRRRNEAIRLNGLFYVD